MSILTAGNWELATGNWQLATGDDNGERPNVKTKTAHQHQIVRWVREFLGFARDKTDHKFEAVIERCAG